ncbi:MAG: hypothetical protein GVY06_02390 [Alphaproteobacteria bacterium]|jgi:hypothetical protein|nr:hypothetical protein [Alphaproteobacteria bacterium]
MERNIPPAGNPQPGALRNMFWIASRGAGWQEGCPSGMLETGTQHA